MTKNPEEDNITQVNTDTSTAVEDPPKKQDPPKDNATPEPEETSNEPDPPKDNATPEPEDPPNKPDSPKDSATPEPEEPPSKPDPPKDNATPEPEDTPRGEEDQAESSLPTSQSEPVVGREEADGEVAGNEKQEDVPKEDTDPSEADMDGHNDNATADPKLTNGDDIDGAPASASADSKPLEAEDEQRADDTAESRADATDQQPSTTEPNSDPTDSGAGEEPSPASDNKEKLTNGEEGTATREGDYEDDFSEISDKSDRGKGAAGAAPAVAECQNAAGDAPQDSKSPAPSSIDEGRAEAGTVVPVPVPIQKSDGRSHPEERGEIRGEDRSEAQCDGGEDSRGEGHWKSEEELFLQSSLTNQQAEKEALQTVIDEKVKVQKEHDDLKGRFIALEESVQKWELEAGVLKEKCQTQDQRIKDLEAEDARLREFEQWGKDNEAKIKDLQDRLAALAGEDAEKDRRIQKLQEELIETRSRLVAAERQTAISNEAALQQQPLQQSKTCTIL